MDELSVKTFCIEKWKDEPMWARYANNEQGFCIQYDALELLRSIKFPILPVWYGEKTYEDASTLSKMSKSVMIFKNFLIKNRIGVNGEDWSAQREWRIVAFKKMLGVNDDNINGKCIDAIKPTKIILGKNASMDLHDRITGWISKKGNEDILIEQRE